MNFLKKTFASGKTKTEFQTREVTHEHGIDFMRKSRQYFEMESIIQKLLRDVKRYTLIWGELLSIKAQIFGYLMYFYSNKKNKKSTLMDDLFKFHQKPMDKYVRQLSHEYDNELMGELKKILKIFPNTQKNINQLKTEKDVYLNKKSVYQQSIIQQNKNKKTNYEYLSNLDMLVRVSKHKYLKKYRELLREFDDKISHKDSILDRFVSNMLLSDYKMYSKTFKVSQILKEQFLIFQMYREYPKGLPGQYKDYYENEELQNSSDTDIEIEKENEKEMNLEMINKFMSMGFDPDIIQNILQKHPNINNSKQMLNHLIINSIPTKDGIILPKLPEHTSSQLSLIIDNDNDSDNNEKKEINDNDNNKISHTSSPPVAKKKKKVLPPSKPQNFLTEIKQESLKRLDSLEFDLNNVKTRISSKSVAIMRHGRKKPPPPRKKKTSFDEIDLDKIKLQFEEKYYDNHDGIQELIKFVTDPEIDKIKPHVVKNKNDNESNEDIYYYCKSHHPLGVGYKDLQSGGFRWLHTLFHPLQLRNIKDSNSLVIPNAIKTHTLFAKVVDINKIEFDEDFSPSSKQKQQQRYNVRPVKKFGTFSE